MQTSVNAKRVPMFSISINSSKFKIHASRAVSKPATILARNGVLKMGKRPDRNLNNKPSLAIE